jgi:hypothetical protein
LADIRPTPHTVRTVATAIPGVTRTVPQVVVYFLFLFNRLIVLNRLNVNVPTLSKFVATPTSLTTPIIQQVDITEKITQGGPMGANVTTQLVVKLVVGHTLDRIHESGMERNPVANLTSIDTAMIQANLKAAMTEISPPVDKLESVARFGKILNVLVAANISTGVLRATAHRIVSTGIIDKLLPQGIRLAIRIGDPQALFRRILTSVKMDMKPTTGIHSPTLFLGSFAEVPNFLESVVTLQYRRNELTPRSATFVNAAPLGLTVQRPIIPTLSGLYLDAETSLRTDLIERTRLTGPRLGFPQFRVTVTGRAERVTFPAANLVTFQGATTLATLHISRIKASAANVVTFTITVSIVSIRKLATYLTLEPTVIPATTAHGVTILRILPSVVTVTLHHTVTVGTMDIVRIVARTAALCSIGTNAKIVTLAPAVKRDMLPTIGTDGIQITVAAGAHPPLAVYVDHLGTSALTAAATNAQNALLRVGCRLLGVLPQQGQLLFCSRHRRASSQTVVSQ